MRPRFYEGQKPTPSSPRPTGTGWEDFLRWSRPNRETICPPAIAVPWREDREEFPDTQRPRTNARNDLNLRAFSLIQK